MRIELAGKEVVVSSWIDKEVLLLYERMKSVHPEGLPVDDFVFTLLIHGIESLKCLIE